MPFDPGSRDSCSAESNEVILRMPGAQLNDMAWHSVDATSLDLEGILEGIKVAIIDATGGIRRSFRPCGHLVLSGEQHGKEGRHSGRSFGLPGH